MRSCHNCDVCCTGILPGEAYGKEFYLNHPCYYLHNKSCTIYETRPTVCRNYRCAWVDDDTIPDNLDPRITNSLIMKTPTELRVFIDSAESTFIPDFVEFATTNNIRMNIISNDILVMEINNGEVSS